MNNYEDIINMPHHISTKHPQMSLENRAAQFAPFAALTGYDDVIKETSRLTDMKLELSEEMKDIINDKLNVLNEKINSKPIATITYFIKDKVKEGGSYITITGNIKQIDLVNKYIILTNKKKISINDIIGISGI
jgi:hypothetical protein